MRMKRALKSVLIALGAILSIALGCAPALAQCAMCKAAAAASSAADTLNLAILVLLIPPVTIFCAIFIVAYRYRGAEGETSCQTPQVHHASHAWMNESSADTKGRADFN